MISRVKRSLPSAPVRPSTKSTEGPRRRALLPRWRDGADMRWSLRGEGRVLSIAPSPRHPSGVIAEKLASWAQRTACIRVCTPSLRMIAVTWAFTVVSAIDSS